MFELKEYQKDCVAASEPDTRHPAVRPSTWATREGDKARVDKENTSLFLFGAAPSARAEALTA